MGGGGGSNFDDLTIDASGRVVPRGPLRLDANEDILGLYAWVIQTNDDGTGAVCVAFEEAPRFRSRTAWTTRDDAIHAGRFRPGPAIGMAVSISRVSHSSEPRVYWWSEPLQLRRADDVPASTVIAMSQAGSAVDLLSDANRLLAEAIRLLRAGGG